MTAGPTSTDGVGSAASNVNVPNGLTLLRILMVPVFGWMLLSHPDDAGWRVGSTVVFAVAILTDSLDGYLARRHDLITSFGKLADPIADKALTGMAFVGLTIVGELWWWVTALILVREWGITLMRFLVLRYGVMAASRGGKLKTVLQAVALVLFLLPLTGWLDVLSLVAMALAFVVTLVTGVDYVLAAVRLRRQGRARL